METAARSVSSEFVPAPKNLFSYFPIEILTATRLSHGSKILFAYISFCSGFPNKTKPVWHSRFTMAKDLQYSVRSISTYLKELRSAGLIARWHDDNKTMTVPKRLTQEIVDYLQPIRISKTFMSAKFAQGVCNISTGDVQNLHTYTNQSIQTKETAASSPAGMKFDREDEALGKRARGKIQDSEARATAQMKEGERKELARRTRIQGKLERQGIETWKGKKFFWFFVRLCRRQAVHISDEIHNVHCLGEDEATAKNVPQRYGRAMNDIIARLESSGLTKMDLSKILERLVIGWKGEVGFASHFVSRKMWRGDDISIYLIRKRFDEVVLVTGFSQGHLKQLVSKLKVPKGNTDDLA